MESSALIGAAALALSGCSLGLPVSTAVAPDVGIGAGPRGEAHVQGGVSADLLPQGHRSVLFGPDIGVRVSSKTGQVNPRYGGHVGVANLPLRYEQSAGYIAMLRVYGQTDAYESTGQGLGFSARFAVPLRLASAIDPWQVERDGSGKIRNDVTRCDVLLAPYIDVAAVAVNGRADQPVRVEEPLTIGLALYIHWWGVVAP